MGNLVASATTLAWILIEAIQFAYMAYLMWRDRNDINRKFRERVRASAAVA